MQIFYGRPSFMLGHAGDVTASRSASLHLSCVISDRKLDGNTFLLIAYSHTSIKASLTTNIALIKSSLDNM